VSTLRLLLAAGLLAAGTPWLVDVAVARADPLVPPSTAEVQFLEQVRRLLPLAGDSRAFNNDAELLNQGRDACRLRKDLGLIGEPLTYVPPVVTQLAFIYLCPN
jgi:hypothetical protein